MENIETLGHGIHAAGSAIVGRRIAESTLAVPDAAALADFVEGFDQLRFAWETDEAFEENKERLGQPLPPWLRAIRAVLSSPVHPDGPVRLVVDLPPDASPVLEGGWAISVVRGPTDETERRLTVAAGLVPVGFGGAGDLQVLAVRAGSADRTLYRYDAEDVTAGAPPTARLFLPDYLDLFRRCTAVEVIGGPRLGRTATTDDTGPEGDASAGMRFFADLSGRSLGEAAADPAATLAQGLRALTHELSALAVDAASDDPERRSRAEERREELRRRLELHAAEAPSDEQAKQAAREKVRQRLGGSLSEAVRRLEALRDEVAGDHAGESEDKQGS